MPGTEGRTERGRPKYSNEMKPSTLLTITSLISIVLLTLHLSDDMVRGFSTPGFDNLTAVAIFVVWLYGTLLVQERLGGYIITFLGSVCAAAMPLVHMRGTRFVETVRSDDGFFFYWTVLMLGTTGFFGMILSARGIWSWWRARRAK